MQKRALGQSGLDIVPLVLGGHVFGWTVDEATTGQILDRFVGEGFNCIDTADIYGRFWMGVAGLSESIIGRWLKRTGKRSSVVLATKVGGLMVPPDGKGLSKAHILFSIEGSLQRLQTDHIDLYQSHVDDPDVPQEETLGAYDLLVKQGNVRAIGASNTGTERLASALQTSARCKFPRYQTLQPKYNLIERASFEGATETLCRENRLGVIPYSPLACGFLTGKYRSEADLSKSKRNPDVKNFLNERGFRILAALDEVAARYQANPAQVALAWLIAQPTVTAPITSATSLAQLDNLIAATRLQLDAAALARLSEASA